MNPTAYKTSLRALGLLAAVLAFALALILVEQVVPYSTDHLRDGSSPDAYAYAGPLELYRVGVRVVLDAVARWLLAFSGVVMVLVLLGVAGLCVQEAATGPAARRTAFHAGASVATCVPHGWTVFGRLRRVSAGADPKGLALAPSEEVQ